MLGSGDVEGSDEGVGSPCAASGDADEGAGSVPPLEDAIPRPGLKRPSYKKCQCNVQIDGEPVCSGFNIAPKQRSVSLARLSRSDLVYVMTTHLGWPPGHKEMLFVVDKLVADARAGTQYRINAAHFELDMLHFTAKTVSLRTRDASGALQALSFNVVSAHDLRARIRLMDHGASLQQALALPRIELAGREPRLLPLERVEARAFAQFDQLCISPLPAAPAAPAKRTVADLRTPARSADEPGRSPAAKVPAVGRGDIAQLEYSARKVLARAFKSCLNQRATVAAESARAQIEGKVLRAELAVADGTCAELAELAAADISLRRAYADSLARIVELERERADLSAKLRARELVDSDLERAAAQQGRFQPWTTSMLEDPRHLGKVVLELTGFRTLALFRTFFATVLDRQGCAWEGERGCGAASRLDYWYGPNHDPASKATSSGSRRGLNPLKPAGLDGPIEACFLTYVMLRCGLSADVVAVLFGISAGSASQIFNTWVPFISKSLQRWSPTLTAAEVRSALPKKFVSGPLSRTTHSAKCRMIIDCTEVWMQTPADPAKRKLFLCAPRALGTRHCDCIPA